ncbi:unnamed protein product [Tilletia controversa]|nr:unnamed protein product [Tilletia controversa]
MAAPPTERTALLPPTPNETHHPDEHSNNERPSSYIIVTAPTVENNRIALLDSVNGASYRSSHYPHPLPAPRFRLFLPVLALVDLLVSLSLCAIAYEQYSHSELDPGEGDDGGAAPREAARRLAVSLLACSVFRTTVLTAVGFSKQTRSMGVLIAATCLLSILFVMSIANMLLEAHALRSATSNPPAAFLPPTPFSTPQLHYGHHLRIPALPLPVLPLFTAQQLLFTVLEWAAFIAVVGVRLPPGRNPIQARRWARSLQTHHAEGVDARSLMEVGGEGDSGSEDEEEVEGEGDDTLEHRHGGDELAGDGRRSKSPDSSKGPSSLRPIAPLSPRFPIGSPSPAPSLNVANPAQQDPHRIPSSSSTQISSAQQLVLDHPSAPPASHGIPDLELQLEASQLSLPASALSPDDDDDDEEGDAQDIIDIPADKQLSRQESRRRLANAYARSNASSSSINDIPHSSSSSSSSSFSQNRRSMTGGSSSHRNRRDSAISVRSTSTTTGMGLPISTPSIPDRRTSTNFHRATSPPLVSPGLQGQRGNPLLSPPVLSTPASGSGSGQGVFKGKAGKLGMGIGLGGRRPSWLGGSKGENSSSSSRGA